MTMTHTLHQCRALESIAMPAFGLAAWREMARKAAQALRRQVQQTEQGLSTILNPGRRPQPIPIPIPQRRAPRFQGDKRSYTQWTAPRAATRTAGATSTFIKTDFGRTATRPRVIRGTLQSHGYGRSNFSTAQINHAQIVREVSQSISLGLRAGVLNTRFFLPTNGYATGHVLHGVCSHETSPLRTYLDITLCPAACIAPEGRLSRDVVTEIDNIMFSAPKYLAQLRRNLSKVSRYGNFDYQMINNDTTIRIAFHGRGREDVERFLKDIDVSCGTLNDEHGILSSHQATSEFKWDELLGVDRPLSSSRQDLEDFVDAVDVERGRVNVR